MTANYARLLFNEQRYGLPAKWLLLAMGVASLLLRPARPPVPVVALYALATLLITLYFVRRGEDESPPTSATPYWISQLIAVGYVTALIAGGSGLASPFSLAYILLALKSLLYAPDIRGMVWLPFLFGPLYVVALWIAHGSLAFLADLLFITRYILLLALVVASVVAAWSLAGRLREVDRLRYALDARSKDLAAQTQTLQRTATDLGDRVLELRALQEVAKALSATLYLNETLHTIAERLSRLVSGAPCAVALLDGERRLLSHLVAAPGSGPILKLPLPLHRDGALWEILNAGRSQVVMLNDPGQALGRHPLSPLGVAWQSTALEVVPMMIRGKPIGALLLGLPGANSENRRQRNLTESFAYFAATSVENARLYGDAAEKRRELEAVLAGIGDGVLVADTEGALLLMNPVAVHILGLEQVPIGAPLHAFPSSHELAGLMEETAKNGHVQIRELVLPSAGLSSDGEPRTFQALAAPVSRATEAGDEVGGVVAVLRDITAQKELERMKSNFLSVVSHELKTPLHSIKGFVDIILMGKTGPVTELQQDFLGTVQEQTGHLQRLIEDLLEFSRLESGQVRLRPTKLDPALLAKSVVEKLAPLAANGQLTMRVDLTADLPQIEADTMRVEQVLTNLVENAIKFTPPGGEIRLLGIDRGDSIEMVVADTGIGIPADERERVFERFYQVDSSARRRFKGTGLGLTICKHVITRHGGQIWVEDLTIIDCPGAGTGDGAQFHFTLPKVFPDTQAGEAALDFGVLAQK